MTDGLTVFALCGWAAVVVFLGWPFEALLGGLLGVSTFAVLH